MSGHELRRMAEFAAAINGQLTTSPEAVLAVLAENRRLLAVASVASHCRQYMMHLGWCGAHIGGPCSCERDEDYAELVELLDAAFAPPTQDPETGNRGGEVNG